MPFGLIEGALGGAGLFLLGMRLMSSGIRTLADVRVRRIFSHLTSNRLYSLLCGLALTMTVNSGSAATLFAVALVNGGLLNAFQAMNVLGGVLIGTSLILYLDFLPQSPMAAPFIFAGVMLMLFARRRRPANAGELVLGIGVLLLGLALFEGGCRSLGICSGAGSGAYMLFSSVPAAALSGTVLSCLVPSPGAFIAVAASLAEGYRLTPLPASALAAGGVAGAALMGNLAALAGSAVARRIAGIMLAMTVAASVAAVAGGYLIIGTLLPAGPGIPAGEMLRGLSRVHMSCSLAAAAGLVLLGSPLARWLTASVEPVPERSGRDSQQPCAGYLDQRILDTPTLAIEQARKEIARMAGVVSLMYADLRELLFDYDSRRAELIRQHEQVLDALNREIPPYLAQISRVSRHPGINLEIPALLQTVTILEQVGDRCEQVLNSIITRKETGTLFSDAAMADLRLLAVTVGDLLTLTDDAVRNNAFLDADAVRQNKQSVRSCFSRVKQAHYERMASGVCPPQAMMLFIDIESSLADIAGLCWSILGMRAGRYE